MKINLTLISIVALTVWGLQGKSKAQAQSTRLGTPMGGIVSIAPGTTITGAGTYTLFSETIPANTFMPVRWYDLDAYFQVTTPLLAAPTISVTYQYGSSVYTATTNSILAGNTTNGYMRMRFKMVAITATSQVPTVEILQPGGTILTLSNSTSQPVGAFTTDSTLDQTFSMVLTLGGTGLGTTTSIKNFWVFRGAF